MSGRFLRHSAVLAGATLLAAGVAAWLMALVPAGLSAAQGPTEKDNAFAVGEKSEGKPAARPKGAEAAPFGAAANPIDPFAAPTKPRVGPAAKGRAAPAVAKTGPPPTRARSAPVEPGAAEAAIEKALAQTVEGAEFDQTPLVDVIDHIARTHRIPIFLDKKALEQASIDPKTTQVTLSLRGISLRSVLDLMLGQVGLTWTIHSEVLLITTSDVADELLITRLYDVADLVGCRDEKGLPWDDYDSLIDAIEFFVAPKTWSDTGAGQGAVMGETFGNARVLIVSQPYQIHREIANFLEDIRNRAGKPGPDQKPPVRQRPVRATFRTDESAKNADVSRAPSGSPEFSTPKPPGNYLEFRQIHPRSRPSLGQSGLYPPKE
jgi:hypothetical protein